MNLPKIVRYSVGEEWSALYVDGRLDRIGDSYLADERIAELAGVIEGESDVMRAVNTRDEAPKTLDELADREGELQTRIESAAILRAEAQRLLDEAASIEANA